MLKVTYASKLLALLTILTGASLAWADTIVHGPYLQSTTSRSVVLRWYSDVPMPSVVRYRIDGGIKRRTDSRRTTSHSLLISGLVSSTKYRMEILSGQHIIGAAYVRTAPESSSAKALRFAVLGDSGEGSTHQAVVSEQIRKWHPEIILHTGDVVYEQGEFADYEQKFFAPYRYLLRRIPFFPVMGNHDDINSADFREVFSLPAHRSGSSDETYYSFNYGRAHIIALNTNLEFGPGSAQYLWLEQDLIKASRRSHTWKIVFFHHPPFSDGEHGDNPSVQSSLLPLFERYGVKLVLSGHDHAYERSTPLNFSGIGSQVVYIVSGAGGRSLYQRIRQSEIIISYEPQYHFVGLVIEQNRIVGRAISEAGIEIDRFVIR